MTPKPFDIPKALVWEAFQNVKDNGGAAGIDQQTIEQFEERLGDNLYKPGSRNHLFRFGVHLTDSG